MLSTAVEYRPTHLLHHLNRFSIGNSSQLWMKRPYEPLVRPSLPRHSFDPHAISRNEVDTTRDTASHSPRWSFDVVATLRCSSSSLQASEAIAAIDFDESGALFASGGMARKIRVYEYTKIVVDEGGFEDGESRARKRNRQSMSGSVMNYDGASEHVICTPAKLSSLKWKPRSSSMVIGTGDYDGMVAEWDVEAGVTLVERYEHCGKKVWSVDYSSWSPSVSASSSSDGTVRIWSSDSEKSVGLIESAGCNSVCCIEFSPFTPYTLATASSDSNAYLYDLRKLDSPLISFHQHQRAASYVRFLSQTQLVSASIDNTVKLWDIPELNLVRSGIGDGYQVRSFGAHTNVKNFVGLAVLRKSGGLIACGSETNELFIYGVERSDPLVNVKFPCNSHVLGPEERACDSFVGAACWKEQANHFSLVAANSEGFVQIMKATSSPPLLLCV